MCELNLPLTPPHLTPWMVKYTVRLLEAHLWRQFNAEQNEMIITKAGRCLFPLLRFCLDPNTISDDINSTIELKENSLYYVYIEMTPTDDHKWKWRQGHWIPLISSRIFDQTPPPSRRPLMMHTLSLADMLKSGLNFDKLKLTNRDDGPNSICLQSFHRYLPIVYIKTSDGGGQVQEIAFPETQFIAVTHYQNDSITILKKSYNPHAKGFVINDENDGEWHMNTTRVQDEDDQDDFRNQGQGFRNEDRDDYRDKDEGKCGDKEENTPSPVPSIRKQGRIRKRIRPVQTGSESSSFIFPSDEEELQASLVLQFLSSHNHA